MPPGVAAEPHPALLLIASPSLPSSVQAHRPPGCPLHTSRPSGPLRWLAGSPCTAAVAYRPNADLPSPSMGSPWQPRGLSGPRASPKHRGPGPSLVPACSSPGAHAFSDPSQVMEEVSPPPGSPLGSPTQISQGPPLLSPCPVCCLPGFSQRMLFSFLICALPP